MNSAVNEICGLELNNPDPELFEIRLPVPSKESEQCTPSRKCRGPCFSCPFLLKCLTPSQCRCLIPKDCQVYELGRKKTEDGELIAYFASKKNDKMVFFRLTQPSCQWADIRRIEEDDLPDWARSNVNFRERDPA